MCTLCKSDHDVVQPADAAVAVKLLCMHTGAIDRMLIIQSFDVPSTVAHESLLTHSLHACAALSQTSFQLFPHTNTFQTQSTVVILLEWFMR
jgi:hypothetical protein